MSITIQYPHPSAGLHPLYRQYPGQSAPQPAYVTLDCRALTLSADYSGEIGNAVPAAVYHGHVREWGVESDLSAQEIADLLNQVAPLAGRGVAGYVADWDGHNYVGCLDEDAQEAENAAAQLCGELQTEYDGVWDAAEWLDGIGGKAAQAEELGIQATSSDAELVEIAERLEAEAGEEGISLDGAAEYLQALREHCREEV